MERTVRPNRPPVFRRLGKSPLKLTALLYIREALRAERYEELRDLIAQARELGAEEFEIQDLLEDPRRQPHA